MTEQADERLKALKASMKEAIGKLTGIDQLEAEGAREKSDGGLKSSTKVTQRARDAPTQNKPKPRASRRRS